MPRGDRTGPLGYGPRSGRGLGVCGFPAGRSGFFGRGGGRGFGRGFRFGPGFGRGFWGEAPEGAGSLESEISFLEERLDELKSLLAKDKE